MPLRTWVRVVTVCTVTETLRGELTWEQRRLLEVIYEPFRLSGHWPVWQYVSLTMEQQHNVDAADILQTIPAAGSGQRAYGLLWRHGSFEPNPDSEIALTVAGLRSVSDAALLKEMFVQVLKAAATALSQVKPDPHKAVPTTIEHEIVTALARQDQRMSAEVNDLPPVGLGLEVAKRRIRVLFEHEPFPVSFSRPSTASEDWTMTVPPFLRRYKDIATVDDYLDRVIADYVPPEMPSAPISPHPLDVPYAAGYLDAVWRAVTGKRLFANLDPASTARLTESCANAEEFNSLMSALADVLSRVAKPDVAEPPQGGALEQVRDWLLPQLEPEAAGRAGDAFSTLIALRRVRVSTQHADARQKAVTAFRDLGLTYPPADWNDTWQRITVMAQGAFDVIREEIRSGLKSSSTP